MAVTTVYTNNGNGTSTIAIAITADTDAMLLLSSEVSESIYNDTLWIREIYGNVAWGTLTNQQKLSIIGRYTQRKLRSIGYQHYYREQQAAIGDITTHYGEE